MFMCSDLCHNSCLLSDPAEPSRSGLKDQQKFAACHIRREREEERTSDLRQNGICVSAYATSGEREREGERKREREKERGVNQRADGSRDSRTAPTVCRTSRGGGPAAGGGHPRHAVPRGPPAGRVGEGRGPPCPGHAGAQPQ